MSQRNILIVLLSLVLAYTCYVRAEQNPYARYVAAGYSVIERWALDDVPPQELFEGAMQGMVGVLRERGDQHSLFVREQIRDDFRVELRQEFGGVGVRIGLVGQPPMPVILGPPEPGTPAFLADIRSGDTLLAVDGTDTHGLGINQIIKLTRGQPGTEVLLTILHEGEQAPEDVSLKRAVINIESVCGDLRGPNGAWKYLLDSNPRIAYIRIISFGDKTKEELDRVMEETTAAGGRSVHPRRARQLRRGTRRRRRHQRHVPPRGPTHRHHPRPGPEDT